MDENQKRLKTLSEIDPFEFRDGGIVSCIGKNTGLSPAQRDFSIAEGFKQSVDIMYSTLTNKTKFNELSGIFVSIDLLVYPFWFNSRHAIELYLKLAIKRLKWVWDKKKTQLTNEQDKEYSKAIKSHNIEVLSHIFSNLVKIDPNTNEAFQEIHHFGDIIKDYFFDDKSDAFRYTHKENNIDINLSDKSTINLSVLYDKFIHIFTALDWFINYVFDNVKDDYDTGTFTNKASRNQISEISKLLPNVDKWTTAEFEKSKIEICSRYSLSSNDFAKIVSIIKEHREFSSRVGLELKFGEISESTIIAYCELIEVYNRMSSVPYLDSCYQNGWITTSISDRNNYTKENYELKLQLKHEFKSKSNELHSIMTKEESALLHSFRELALLGGYRSEDLDMVYQSWLIEESSSMDINYNEEKFPTHYSHIMKGMDMCGQLSHLKLFQKRYSEIVK